MLAASTKGASFLVTTVQWKSADQASNQLVDDLKNIQGTWQATYLEEGGSNYQMFWLLKLQHVFEKDALTMIVGKKEKQATYKLDPTTSPKSIDIIKKGETVLGIYENDVIHYESASHKRTNLDQLSLTLNPNSVVMHSLSLNVSG